MTLLKKDLEKLEELINNNESITLISHSSPDADTIGSALALQNILLQMGKKVSMVCPNQVADFLLWMPNVSSILIHDKEGGKVKNAILNADLIFAMDFNAPHRTTNVEKLMLETKAKKILIDHHLFPDEAYFDLMFSCTEKSSTCELLFDIIMATKLKAKINKEIATLIFVGLMTDTGSFAYSCNSPETFETAAQLIRFGVDVKQTHDLIYNNSSIDRLKILGYCINEKLKVFPENNAAYMSLSAEEIKKYGNTEGLTEGIVNYALSIRGICFAALLTEKDNKIKISFRSKGNYSVNDFARANFEGGGHFNAAGGKSFLSLIETENKLEELISKLDIKC